jgi:hypothetical protein
MMAIVDAVIESMLGRCERCGATLRIKSIILKNKFWSKVPHEYQVFARCGTRRCFYRTHSSIKRFSYEIVQEEVRRVEDRRRRLEMGL